VVILGEGLRLLGRSGSELPRKATAHFYSIEALQKDFPQIEFIPRFQVLTDGKWITSSGVYNSTEASLAAIESLAGPLAGAETRNKLELMPLAREKMIEPRELHFSDYFLLFFQSAFTWSKKQIGVYVDSGVDELSLASALEIYPRTFAARVVTLGEKQELMVSANGLWILPKIARADAPPFDLVVYPKMPNSPMKTILEEWAQGTGSRWVDLSAVAPSDYPYFWTNDVAQTINIPSAILASRLALLPGVPQLQGPGWPYLLFLRVLILGLLGAGIAYPLSKKIFPLAANSRV